MGRGGRGHQRPSRANTGSFYWFIKLLTPHLPGNCVAAQRRDLVRVEEEGTGQGESGSEDDRAKLLVNLMGAIQIIHLLKVFCQLKLS